MRARGGSVNKGTKVFEASEREGTQVSHKPGKNDLDDMNRKRVVTFATGGGVKSFTARAKGGPIYSAAKGQMGPDMPGGAGGGKGRLAKIKAYGP